MQNDAKDSAFLMRYISAYSPEPAAAGDTGTVDREECEKSEAGHNRCVEAKAGGISAAKWSGQAKQNNRY